MPPRPGSAVPACVLGLLLPGAGHLYLGRRGKGLFLLAAIGALFLLGLGLDARLQVYLGLDDPLAFLRSLAQMAIGLPYVLARTLGVEGPVTAVMHEYGNTFTEVSGLLNVLAVLDAHDIAVGRKP
jgi:hypothetical protein